MVLGRLPDEGRSRALVYEEFYAEPICLVVRRGHPLLRKRRLGLRELTNEPWLLPLPETALRRQIERAFLDAAAPLPRNVIESVSILTNRVLLRKSDCIGVMPYHVALDDVEQKLLAILPVKAQVDRQSGGGHPARSGRAAAGGQRRCSSACASPRAACRRRASSPLYLRAPCSPSSAKSARALRSASSRTWRARPSMQRVP